MSSAACCSSFSSSDEERRQLSQVSSRSNCQQLRKVKVVTGSRENLPFSLVSSLPTLLFHEFRCPDHGKTWNESFRVVSRGGRNEEVLRNSRSYFFLLTARDNLSIFDLVTQEWRLEWAKSKIWIRHRREEVQHLTIQHWSMSTMLGGKMIEIQSN